MHVFIIPSWYTLKTNPIRGVFFKEQAQALQKYGLNVTVLYSDLWSIKQFGKYAERKGVSFEVEEGLNTFRYNGYNFLPRVPYIPFLIHYYRLKKLYKLAVEKYGKPDLIHAHSCIWGGIVAVKIAKEENLPLVITEHSSALSRGLIKPYQKKLITRTLEFTQKLIVVGPSLEKEMQKYTSKEKIEIIPNIVDVDKFNLIQTPKNKNFRFLSVAILTYNKGMDILIKAFAHSFKGKEVELIIGGDGEERAKLEQLALSLGVSNQITFLGQLSREQVKEQMQQCDAFVLASRHETFGVVYIEALACGKPIIATACGGPEMIVNEGNGLLVPVEDVKKLGKAMNKIFDNYEIYKKDLIRRDCIERFSERAVVNDIYKIYRGVIVKKMKKYSL